MEPGDLTIADFAGKEGRRVEMSPHTDAWMQGDRYGEIESVGRKLVKIKMDRSLRTLTCFPRSINQILPEQ